jgi:hypothetical protein
MVFLEVCESIPVSTCFAPLSQLDKIVSICKRKSQEEEKKESILNDTVIL